MMKYMRQATLCLLMKDDKILLAMKKRGFGVGKWNGTGGKALSNESIFGAAVRETEEEIGVKVKDMEKVAVLSFFFPSNKEWDQDVHVYLVRDWEGEPVESEEMFPQWFDVGSLPFDSMWDDDKYWLPKVLKGEKLKADFTFDNKGDKVVKHSIYEKTQLI